MRHDVKQENQKEFTWKIVGVEETGIENGWASLQTAPIFLRSEFLYSEGFEQEQEEFLNEQYRKYGYALHVGTERVSLEELGREEQERVCKSFELVVKDLQGEEKPIWVNLFYNAREYKLLTGDCHLPSNHLYDPFCVFRSYDDEKQVGRVLKQKPLDISHILRRECVPLTMAYAN
ncbi:hypothetical protein K8R20_00475 [bacterium]|nr:hypothetical protein [bacterium]